jgi:hypothetical protein
MSGELSRREFFASAAAASAGLAWAGRGVVAGDAPSVTVCNPLLRTPLALIIDDSCPVINKAYYWIQQRHDWRLKHAPDSAPSGWEVHYDKLGSMPNTIPAAFAERWGQWCGEKGIKGKFSMVPFPAGMAAERPCILVGHWPCFYTNDHVGFRVLKEVKRRLDAYDSDGTKTLWMKTSEIAHYWMARSLTDVQTSLDEGRRECTIRLSTKFPTDNFTLAIQDRPARRVRYNETNLRLVKSLRDFRSGTFLIEDNKTFVAMSLPTGATTLTITR